ncbi:MAG: hypothetical protein WDN26_01600 [Chitinophagaceae bacterium]
MIFRATLLPPPRNGNYTFTFVASSTDPGAINTGGTWEAQVVSSYGNNFVARYISPAAYTGVISINGAYTTNLPAGATVTFKLYNSVGASKTLAADNYNRF